MCLRATVFIALLMTVWIEIYSGIAWFGFHATAWLLFSSVIIFWMLKFIPL